jgi:hypothetical protein
MRPLDFNWRDVALIKKCPERGARWFATFAVMASFLYVIYVIIAAGVSSPLSRYSPRSFAFVFGEELRHPSPPLPVIDTSSVAHCTMRETPMIGFC